MPLCATKFTVIKEVLNLNLAILVAIENYLGVFRNRRYATKEKTILGNQAAKSGGKFPLVANTVENLSDTINKAAICCRCNGIANRIPVCKKICSGHEQKRLLGGCIR